VPATITFSADFKTVTLQPNSNLTGGGVTYYFEIGYWAYLYDVGGNQLSYGYIQFTTTEAVDGRTRPVTDLLWLAAGAP
jgi:hypothetical protein